MATCAIEGCPSQAIGRGWCRRHYSRWYNTGSPTGSKRRSWEERLWDRVLKGGPGECWLWQGSLNPDGYASLTVDGDKSRRVVAHRAVWELLRGPIGENLELDHLCRVPRCVNPDHLEPVTRQVNMERSRPWRQQWNMTHCKRGHEFTPENTYVQKSGGRMCRACVRYRMALKRERKRTSTYP